MTKLSTVSDCIKSHHPDTHKTFRFRFQGRLDPVKLVAYHAAYLPDLPNMGHAQET